MDDNHSDYLLSYFFIYFLHGLYLRNITGNISGDIDVRDGCWRPNVLRH